MFTINIHSGTQIVSQEEFLNYHFEYITGAGSDYPTSLTPLGFICTYSLKDQDALLPYLCLYLGEYFYSQVIHLRSLPLSELSSKSQFEPLSSSPSPD